MKIDEKMKWLNISNLDVKYLDKIVDKYCIICEKALELLDS